MDRQTDRKRSNNPLVYIGIIFRYSAWLIASFAIAVLLTGLLVSGLNELNIKFAGIGQTTLNVAIGAIMYGLMLAIVVSVPWLLWRKKVTLKTLGLSRPLEWKDIGLAIAGVIAYFVLTIVLSLLAIVFFTGIDMNQSQDLSGIKPTASTELLVVFGLLVIVGPLVEELLFRGYLFGKIRQAGVPFWLTALVVSLVFGAVHMQWNVGIDTFALSLVMCLTREATGTIWPSILMHMTKNGIAFYALFVASGSLTAVGG